MAQAKNIDNQIINYLYLLSPQKKKAVLTVVKNFAKDTPILWDMMPVQVRKQVEKGLEQSKNGLGKPHDEIMKKYNKWLKK